MKIRFGSQTLASPEGNKREVQIKHKQIKYQLYTYRQEKVLQNNHQPRAGSTRSLENGKRLLTGNQSDSLLPVQCCGRESSTSVVSDSFCVRVISISESTYVNG